MLYSHATSLLLRVAGGATSSPTLGLLDKLRSIKQSVYNFPWHHSQPSVLDEQVKPDAEILQFSRMFESCSSLSLGMENKSVGGGLQDHSHGCSQFMRQKKHQIHLRKKVERVREAAPITYVNYPDVQYIIFL